MTALLFLLTLFCYLQACPRTTTPPSPYITQTSPSGTTYSGYSTSTSPLNKEIEVQVTTNQAYDPMVNDAHLQVVRALLNDYGRINGIDFNRNLAQETIKNVNGKFAIIFTVVGADCDAIYSFASGVKRSSNFITTVKLRCGENPERILK